MDQYVVISQVNKSVKDSPWWMDQDNSNAITEVYSSFEEAKKTMREQIRQTALSCKFFPMKGKEYGPIKEFIDDEECKDLHLLKDIISNVISNAEYEYKEDPCVDFTDDGDWYFAFVGKPDFLLAYSDEKALKLNVHNMSDSSKNYYFEYTEECEEGSDNSISIRLYKVGDNSKNNQ